MVSARASWTCWLRTNPWCTTGWSRRPSISTRLPLIRRHLSWQFWRCSLLGSSITFSPSWSRWPLQRLFLALMGKQALTSEPRQLEVCDTLDFWVNCVSMRNFLAQQFDKMWDHLKIPVLCSQIETLSRSALFLKNDHDHDSEPRNSDWHEIIRLFVYLTCVRA